MSLLNEASECRSDAAARGIRRLLGLSLLTTLAACQQAQVAQMADTSAPATTVSPTPAAAAPTVTLVPSPGAVATDQSVTLKWSATGAQSCTASGGWTGAQPTSGAQNTLPLTATTQFMLTCTGAGGTASQSATVTVSAASAPSVSLGASPTSVASGDSSTLTWSSTNATACTGSGGWSGSIATAGSKSTGAISLSTTYTVTCTGSGGSDSQSTTVAVATGAPTGGTVPRPSYNTGDGFFVLNGKLYDPNGNEFRMRGVNRNHWDSNARAGLALSGANAVRTFMDFTRPASSNVSLLQSDNINDKEVPVPTYSGNNGGLPLTSCNNSTTVLNQAVSAWTSQASTWTTLNKYMIIDVANEWGPQNSTVWRDSYVSAISSLRAAGYLGPIMIDTGGCGQDANDLLNYSSAVFNSDPQKNIIFSYHVYGGYSVSTTLAELNALAAQFAALSAADGMVFVFGEFGPGRDIGPSPTMITPAQVISAADTNGIGWLAWAWDDNDLANAMADDRWFSMTYKAGVYTQPSDLTIYGKDVVLNPTYGITAIAKRASIF
jgi:Cellulase (glycosyl hydrolase family 5)